MTLTEILDQAKSLSLSERRELAKMLIDSLAEEGAVSPPKTGADIVAMLGAMDPVEFVDADIEDPVEWVKTQRRKEADRLKPYLDTDHD